VWQERRDTPWPQLLAYWGVPNLQVINRDIHAAKCAEEAKYRGALRKVLAPGETSSPAKAGDPVVRTNNP
jgi:hypothetical protein